MSTQVTGLLLGDARQTVIGTREAINTRAISYNAYGWRRQAGVYPPSGFNGQHAEVQTGWYHLGNGHRIYNPILQRFHSPDPLSPFKIGGLNPYAYCLGDPVNYQDPSGSAAELPDWAIPVMTIAGNSAAFSAIFLAAVLGKPRPIGLLGTRLTMVGAPVAIIGASIQLAGKRQEGQVVGIAGSALTAIGSKLRFAQSLINLAKKTHPWTEFKAGARHVFGLKPPKVIEAEPGIPLPTLVTHSSIVSVPPAATINANPTPVDLISVTRVSVRRPTAQLLDSLNSIGSGIPTKL